MQSSWNRFPFCSEDWHLVPSMRPFLIDPLGESLSLCLLMQLDISMCWWSILSLSCPPPIWCLCTWWVDYPTYVTALEGSFCKVHEYRQRVVKSYQSVHFECRMSRLIGGILILHLHPYIFFFFQISYDPMSVRYILDWDYSKHHIDSCNHDMVVWLPPYSQDTEPAICYCLLYLL